MTSLEIRLTPKPSTLALSLDLVGPRFYYMYYADPVANEWVGSLPAAGGRPTLR